LRIDHGALANQPGGEQARGRTSQGANRLGGETAKGRKSQIPSIAMVRKFLVRKMPVALHLRNTIIHL